MACGSCGKRGHLLGAAVVRAVQNKPVMPLVRAIGRTIQHDVSKIGTNPVRNVPPSPRLTGRFR